LLVLVSATTGITIGTGRATPLPAGMLIVYFLTAIWFVRMALSERKVQLKPSALNTPLLAFLVAAMISWLVGYVIWDWKVPTKANLWLVQAGQYAVFAGSVLAFLLTSNHPLGEKGLRRWTVIIIAIGLASIGYELITSSVKFREIGITGSMLMWPLVLLWAQLIYNPEIKPWMRMVGWMSLPVWALWIYRESFAWKGGWVPALLGLGLLIWLYSRRVAIASLFLGALVCIPFGGKIISTILSAESASGSLVRPLYWYDVIRMTSHSIIVGLGPVSYSFYWLNPKFIPLSRIASGWDKWNAWGYNPPSHNMFVDIYAQTGLVGLILFVWAIVAAVRLALKLRKRFAAGFLQAYVSGFLCGFVALSISSFIFADWMMPYVYNITITGFSHSVYTWLLLGTLVALDISTQDTQVEPTA
jgi:hypothetical protein